MTIINDIRYAIRVLAKRPGFTLLTTLVMATGISLSVYLCSFIYTMDSKALPFKDGESLVVLNSYQKGVMDYGEPIDLHDYYEIRTQLKGLSEFGAYINHNVNVSGRGGARQYNAIVAEPNIFQITRTKPILGREFTDAENQMGAEPVVVIGYDVWQNRFGGDAHVINKILRINGVGHRIVGVMPKGYFFPYQADIWMPMRQDATKLARGKAGSFYGIAHIDDGVTMKSINRQLSVIMQRTEEQYPESNHDKGAYVATLHDSMGIRDGYKVVYSMYVVAILIFFLASINVGNLLLSRAIESSKETAIRMALGAPRSHIITQMLWESIIICSVGGVIGLLLIAWGLEVTQAIVATFSFEKPAFWWKFGIDSFTIKLFFTFMLSTILIAGFLPAWKNSGTNFNAALRDGTRGALGKITGRLSRLLVIGEIFLSIAVTIAAAVVIVGSYMSTIADYGANTDNILTARIVLTKSRYDSPEKQIQVVKTVQSQLENSNGIGAVMIISALPGMTTSTTQVALDAKEYSKEEGFLQANYIRVTPGSLAKLGIELKEGRYFTSLDEGLEKKSAIVTQSFVSRHFPSESPIGKRIRIVETNDNPPDWITIVGVVEHTIQGEAGSGDRGTFPSIFRPFSQAPVNHIVVAMQMQSEISVATRTLRKQLEFIDSELPAFRIQTYTQLIGRNSSPVRFISKVFLLLGVAAVVLAASGIYGVMSNSIHQRTQEIGVKRALGAMDQRITREFLMTGFKHLLWGGIPGLLAGCAMGFAMSKMFGIGNVQLLVIAITMIVIIASVVLLATYLPTKRALQIEPGKALHYE